MEKNVPPQFANKAEAKVFNELKESVETVEVGTTASNVFLNALIAGSLQQIWVLVPQLQITILIPFFAIQLPANALVVLNMML